MESQPQIKSQAQQPAKLNGLITTKNLLTLSNGCANKPVSPKPSTFSVIPLNGAMNSSAKNKESNEKDLVGPKVNPQPMIGPQLPSQNSPGFIGPQLPQKLMEKSHPRIVAHPKNGKILNGNSLVPYDGSSEEEESGSNLSKNSSIQNSSSSGSVVPKSANASTSLNNGSQKAGSIVKEISLKSGTSFKGMQKIVKGNGNGVVNQGGVKLQQVSVNGASQSNKNQQNGGAANNGVQNLLRNQNSKGDTTAIKPETNGKEKWHNPIRVKTDQEERVPTKAAASSIKGWQVSKDTPSPTAAVTPNGWSVTDNK